MITFKIRPRPGFSVDHTPTTDDRFPVQVFVGVSNQTMQLTGELQLKLAEWNVLESALRPYLAYDPGVKVVTNDQATA